jgi:hypothetical protein
MASLQELAEIHSNVAGIVRDDENVDRITYLLSLLTPNDRAAFIFNPALLQDRFDNARHIVQLQGRGDSPDLNELDSLSEIAFTDGSDEDDE